VSDQPFALARGQVTGINAAAGTCTVGVLPAGNGVTFSHVVVAGNATSGLHWMPRAGDWVLVAYEPGMQPQIIAPLLDRTQAAQLAPPLAAGEVRLSSAVTGVVSAIDPRAYGPVDTTGATTSDVAWAGALAAASAGPTPGVIVPPPGKIKLSPFVVPSGVSIIGWGWGTTYLIPASTSADFISVAVGAGTKANHTKLAGFAIYPTSDFSAGAAIRLGNVGKVTLRDIKIDGSLGGRPYYGVRIDQTSDTAFSNVRVEGTVSDGWYVATADGKTIVELFWDSFCTARNAGGWGVHVAPGNATSGDIEGLHWEATSIYSNTAGGILLDTGASGTKTIRNIHLNGTYLDTNGGPGLQVQGTPVCENLAILNVWASANGGRGLDLGANLRAFQVHGGLVQQNGLDGVQVSGAQNGSISNLLVKSNSQTTDLASYGLVMTGSTQEVVVSALHIYNDSGGYPHRQNGVYVGNSVLDIDFKNIKADTGAGTTKLSHNAASSQRVRYASFQDNTGSNNVEQGMSISSGTAIYTRDGFGSIAMTGNLGVSGSATVKQLTSSLTGGGKVSQGSGAPSLPNGLNPAVGDVWLRTDTPGVANQRIYFCTVGGATPTWVGVV
jgi:hypothetical protein